MEAANGLSDEELRRIESRAQAATAGPWFSYVVGRDLEAGMSFIELGSCEAIHVLGGTVADQDFIAHAREDLPRLIKELRELRRRITG